MKPPVTKINQIKEIYKIMSFYKRIQALKEYENIEYNEIYEVFNDCFKCNSGTLANKDMLEFMKNVIFCDWWIEELVEELANSEVEYLTDVPRQRENMK